MAQFLFVHGTSVRKDDYNETIWTIERALKPRGHTVSSCLWGEHFGVPVDGWGKTIPNFEAKAPVDPDHALWILLFQDPFFRIRDLGLVKPEWDPHGEPEPGAALWNKFLTWTPNEELLQLIEATGRLRYWEEEIAALRVSAEFAEIVRAVPIPPADASAEVARAIVASFLIRTAEAGAPALDHKTRDEIIDRMARQFGVGMGPWDPPLSFLFRSARGRITRGVMKSVADILLYQSRGEAIRNVIREKLEAAPAPIVLLAHSLGGIAAVDVLIEKDYRQKVSHLITAGSQAPFVYELNALHSLPLGKVLPEHFPANWLNIYDESDILSFMAKPAFTAERVTDFENKSRQPPLAAHSAYWDSSAVWQRIEDFLA